MNNNPLQSALCAVEQSPAPAHNKQQTVPRPPHAQPSEQNVFDSNYVHAPVSELQQVQPRQKRLPASPPQGSMPEKRQRFDGPNLNKPVQHQSPQPSFRPLQPQDTWVYPDDGDRRSGQSSDNGWAHKSGGNCSGTSTVTVATQFQGARNVNISGNPSFTNLGSLTTVNNYGRTHGLEDLKEFVSLFALHDSYKQDPDLRCHPGTRKNVLGQLRNWIDNPNSAHRIFWLYGPVGAGKSAIARTIADTYEEGKVVATFFFCRSDPNRNNGNRLFPTIAWQLAFSILATEAHIARALHSNPDLPTKTIERQFERLVAQPFQPTNGVASQMPHPAPVVIIDGLDECSEEQLQRRILTIIGNAVKNHRMPLRFLICSRPEALIEETLNQFKNFILRIDLATLDDSHRDINKYLEDKFSDISSKSGMGPAWPGKEIIDEIVFKSSGNFILPSTLVRFIGDDDYNPESQLDIVRKLKPQQEESPFALLDQLYLEVLKRPWDQVFLKTFLALLVGRNTIGEGDLHKDDATLMNVSEKEPHTKLRKMRSLLKLEPFIDVYHKSFLDFLQDSSRSGQYYVSKQGGQKRYLELVVDSVIRHVSEAIKQVNCHERCHSSPIFESVARYYPPKIVLPVEDWQDALQPLLHFQDELLKTSNSHSCRVTQAMRNLLLHLAILRRNSNRNDPNMNEASIGSSSTLVTKDQQNIPGKDVDSLSVLFSCLQSTDSMLGVDRETISSISALLASNYTATAARVRSISDGQKLIDIIDLLTNNKSVLSQCGRDVIQKVSRLASEIFAKVPVLPRSLFLNGSTRTSYWCPTLKSSDIEVVCQSALISRILDRNYVVPLLWQEDNWSRLVAVHVNKRKESIVGWLKRSKPKRAERIRIMLEIAKIIQYIYSMDIALDSASIRSQDHFALDSKDRVKFLPRSLFGWWVKEASIFGCIQAGPDPWTRESNISAFADLFHNVWFGGLKKVVPNPLIDAAKQLIERCRAEDSQSRPTIDDVIKEMEGWNST